jgi:hypothetical protein
MKRALYLDDQRTPTTTIPGYHPWEVVRNYDEFVAWIEKNGVPDLVSFDHDLAEEHINDYFNQKLNIGWQQPSYETYKEKTGLDCARWLCEYVQKNNLKLNLCSVHSHNPIGAVNIQSYINGFKKHMDWDQDCYIGKHDFVVEK